MRSLLFGAASAAVILGGIAGGEARAAEAGAPAVDVEEVVVTGEKSSRSLQDTVSSVAVTTARKIEAENIQTVFDIFNRTANVSETYGPTGFTIRGINNANVSGAGGGALATIYVDGAAMPERAVYSGPLDMWDVGQVEVLRGPQSTIQGRNALAGAVVIRSTDPTWDWSFRARAITASEGDRQIAAAFGGPLIADQLAFRVAIEDRDLDGFVYNQTRHEDNDPTDSLAVRAKLLWTPKALDDLKVLATYSHARVKTGYQFSYARTDTPDYFDHRIDLSNDPNFTHTTTDIATVEADYQLSARMALTGVVSWNSVDYAGAFDGDFTPQTIAKGAQTEKTETFSQELRLHYGGDRLDGLIGLYHSKRDRTQTAANLTNVPFPTSTLVSVLTAQLVGSGQSPAAAGAAANAFAKLYVAALPVIPVDYTQIAPDTVETSALFLDGAFHLTPRLSLLGGFRYDHEENTIATTQTARFSGTYPSASAFGAYAPYVALVNAFVGQMVGQASASTPATTRAFDAALPKLGLKYAWTDDISTSFVVQRGYRSGGSSINVARSSVASYDPEYTWNYELSFRSLWLDGRLSLNANVYYVDWTDQQVQVNLGLNAYDYQTLNAGKSHLYGFELEAAHKLGPHFDWYASVGEARTKFEDFKVSIGQAALDFSGSEFAYAPHWTAAIGGNWRWGGGWMLNLNASYRSDAYDAVGLSNQTRAGVDARTLVNGRFGYETRHWSASIYANNIFDDHYVQYARPADHVALLGDPRVIGAVLETRW